MVARQWQNVPENEKKSWKQRAKLASASPEVSMNNEMEYDDDEEDIAHDSNAVEIEHEHHGGDDEHDENDHVDHVEDVVNQLVGTDANGGNIVVPVGRQGTSEEDIVEQTGQQQQPSIDENNTMHV